MLRNLFNYLLDFDWKLSQTFYSTKIQATFNETSISIGMSRRVLRIVEVPTFYLDLEKHEFLIYSSSLKLFTGKVFFILSFPLKQNCMNQKK